MLRQLPHFRPLAVQIFIATSSLAIIAIFLYCGLFAVPSADDYAYANLIHNKQFLQAQVDSYLGWSSRYTATLLITWLAGYHLQSYWIIPRASISLLCVSFSLLFWTFFFDLRKQKYYLLFPICFLALYLAGSVSGHGVGVVNEGFFWLSGAVTYQFGAACYFLFLTSFIWLTRGRLVGLNAFLCACFLVLGMGSNETLMLLYAGSIFLSLWFLRKKIEKNHIALSIICVCCFFIVIFAPGNSVRLATAEGHNLLSALGICVEKLVQTFFYSLVNPGLWLFIIYFRSIITTQLEQVKQYVTLRYFYIFLVFLIYCLYFPVAWSLDSGAPDRLLSFIGFIGLLASVYLGHALLTKLTKYISISRLTVIFSLLVICLFPFLFTPLHVAVHTMRTGKEFKAQHLLRDRFVALQAKTGVDEVRVQKIKRNPLLMFKDLDISDHAVHYSAYYGVKRVVIQ